MSGSGSSRPVDGAVPASDAGEGRSNSQKRTNYEAGSSCDVLASGTDAGSAGCGSSERGGKRQACGEGMLGVSVLPGASLFVQPSVWGRSRDALCMVIKRAAMF